MMPPPDADPFEDAARDTQGYIHRDETVICDDIILKRREQPRWQCMSENSRNGFREDVSSLLAQH